MFTLLLMGLDKWKAVHHKFRISESTLLLCSLFFGSFGITLGMLLFHHKIRKVKFIYSTPIFFLIQLIILLKLVM